MHKIASTNNKSIIVKYFIKIIFTSIISLILLNTIISFLFLKLDLPLEYVKYVELAVVAICSVFISFISISGFKQNYILLSVIAEIPLILFSFVNFLINNTDTKIFIVKIILIVIISVIISFIKSMKKSR